jgi:nucleoside-specific outer membrane channel protein Tsx
LPVIDDLSVVAGLNIGNLPRQDPFRAYLLGAGLKFKAPAMDYLKLDIMAFKADNLKTIGLQVSPIWAMTFQLGRSRFLFKGFIDWQSADATGGEALWLAQPQLLLDMGHYWGQKNQLYVGMEYSYWYNKFGIDGVIESVPQAMILMPF